MRGSSGPKAPGTPTSTTKRTPSRTTRSGAAPTHPSEPRSTPPAPASPPCTSRTRAASANRPPELAEEEHQDEPGEYSGAHDDQHIRVPVHLPVRAGGEHVLGIIGIHDD